MNDEMIQSGTTSFWPTALLLAAFNLFLLYQVHSLCCVTVTMKKQERFLAQQAAAAQNMVGETRKIEANLSALLNDLFVLGNTDAEVRRFLDSNGIRREPVSAPAR